MNAVKFAQFTYQHILCILCFDSKCNYYVCRTTQKEKQQCEMEDQKQAMQKPTSDPQPNISSVPVTPTVSMPVSSRQSTPHTAPSVPNPFETSRSTRHSSYPTTPASPASTSGT